jgi:hypothetical protein
MMEPGFEHLQQHSQYLKLGGLGLMLLTVALLILPSSYHRIVEEGEDTREIHRFASKMMLLALWPFALALGIDFFVATDKLLGHVPGIIAGVAALLVALFFWNGLEAIRRPQRAAEIMEKKEMSEMKEKQEEGEGGSKTKDKIRHVLTEARTVLPGAQALLGFQLVGMLMESFDKLPQSSKYVHLASLAFTALATVFLMTPAAYHRIVEEGEETEHFHRFASLMLTAALVPLALGTCGDVFVVTRKVLESGTIATGAAVVALLFFYGLWFGYTIYQRGREQQKSTAREASLAS